MRNLPILILVVTIIFSLSSCAIHSGLTGNMNNSTTNVVLQTNNYKIIKKVTGTATGTRVLCLFGGYQKPLVEKARSQMLESANLIGKPRAVINETVEVNNKFFVVVGFKTVTVSAYVIEFVDTEIIEGDGTSIITPTKTEKPLKTIESFMENEIIIGKWVSKNGDFEISIDGDVGVFSQIKSGEWFPLLKRGKIRMGDTKMKDIIPTGELTWKCKELLRASVPSSYWATSSLTLNKNGDMLKVSTEIGNYTLSKVIE